ncbi:MAG: dihydroneopterin aldolase [Chloroflexota bacterium]
MTDGTARLELTGLRCQGWHGAYPGERDRSRTFLVDIAVRGDPRISGGDASGAGIPAEALAAAARRVVAGTPRALLERVADDIARALLDEFAGLHEVSVRVVKPEPDGLDADAEAVTVTRSRPAPREGRSPSAPPERPAPRRARE